MLFIDALIVSMRFSVRFCVYERIKNYVYATLFERLYFSNDGDATPSFFFIFKLLPWPWDLSHRVERQKPMVNGQEEMSVRVQKCGFRASLLLHYNFGPNVLFETL